MRVDKRRLLFVALTVIALVITGVLSLFITACTGETVSSTDIYGVAYSATAADIRAKTRAAAEINALSRDELSGYENKLKEYGARLEDYLFAVKWQGGDREALSHWAQLPYSERPTAAETAYNEFTSENTGLKGEDYTASIESKIKANNTTLELLSGILTYDQYTATVAEQAETLSGISLFSDNRFLLNNIVKTRRDYYGLEGLRTVAACDDGVMLLINNRTVDLFALLIIVMSVLIFAFGSRRPHGGAGLCLLVVPLAGIMALYVGGAVLIKCVFGLPPLGAAVQSLGAFRGCPYAIDLGTFGAFWLLSKLCGCAVLLLAASVALSLRGKKRCVFLAVSGGFLLFELLSAFLFGDNNALFRELNLLSLFTPERFFIRYLNLNAFGLAVSRLPIFIAAALLLLVPLSVAARLCRRRLTAALTEAAERDYYNEINRRYDESRKIRHDISNHLLAINELINTGKVDEARRYIDEVSERLDCAIMPLKTGCDVLDALLYKKSEAARALGITLSFDVGCPIKGCGVADYDLCALFGNLIDNALTAADRLTENRTVTVTVARQLSMLYIAAENPFEGELKKQNGEIVTTKRDSSNHGYGLARINEIARRYGGCLEITAENGVFRAAILLNS